MNHGTCYIFGAGEMGTFAAASPEDIKLSTGPEDCIIAADGGLRCLQFLNVVPDVIIGDFDSLGEIPAQREAKDLVCRLPVEKDDTDIRAAILEGISRGYHRFAIYGGLGGARFDHTIGNMQLAIWLARNGYEAFFYGNKAFLCAVHNTRFGKQDLLKWEPAAENADIYGISVFAADQEARGVTISGLKYEVEDATLRNDFPLGISNETVPGRDYYIEVLDGTVVITGWKGSGI